MPGTGRRQSAGGVMMVDAVVSVSTVGRRRSERDAKLQVSIGRVTRSRLEMTNRSPKFFRC